jgi:hypothetical protein
MASWSVGRSALFVKSKPFVSRSLAPPLMTRGLTWTIREAGSDMIPPMMAAHGGP